MSQVVVDISFDITSQDLPEKKEVNGRDVPADGRNKMERKVRRLRQPRAHGS
uniref:Uncharacterized protein n=1 Tax=Panthera tigris altaica TaxID=74533 RepID=A0A8C9JZL1_PANTA